MQIWFGKCCREVSEMPRSDWHETVGGRTGEMNIEHLWQITLHPSWLTPLIAVILSLITSVLCLDLPLTLQFLGLTAFSEPQV